jgi:hypothetical protein
MGWDKKFYPKNAAPAYSTQFDGLNREHQYFYLRLAIIEDMDPDTYMMRITWYEQNGARDDVPISFPYIGPAGCIGSYPEKGSVGIFGFFKEGPGKGSPLLLACIPRSLYAGLNTALVKTYPDSIPTADFNVIEYKWRKMTEGDAVIRAPAGGYVFLNKNVEIADNMQDSILLREGDQSILSTSLNNFAFADGASVSMGPAMRNRLVIYDESGNKFHPYGSIFPQASGKSIIYIVRHGEEIDYNTNFYTEHRIDVDEFGDGKIDLNDINSASISSIRDPIVTQAMGNYIGAAKNPLLYGYPLKVKLFASQKDGKGAFSLERCTQSGGVDEPSILGMAYALHFLKSGAFMGFDKEGHHYLHLPASRMNPLGAGRSMSILAHGNLKEIWGSNASDNNSWDLTATGGVRWNIGSHNGQIKSRSIQINTTGGIYIEAGNNDDDTYTTKSGTKIDGFAKHEVLRGNVLEQVGGSKVQVSGPLDITVNGLKTENITGSAEETVQSEKSVSVSGNYAETVIKQKQNKFGSRKTLISTGDDETQVIKGSLKESITLGKRITEVGGPGVPGLPGPGITQSLMSGTCSTTVKAGQYKVNVTAGGIEIKTSAGTVKISGTSVSINGTVIGTIDAPIVKIGKGAPFGGAVTGLPGIPSDFCKISGVPFKGSMKVGIA